ncbi:type III-B CRISPR module RAMP protein Cmr6 [Candidatus Oscillochloris fontis]|uniref:type III-B CRISPR module RAMP protein Cmr6 n=1 Tax=Candidatus Oscillochloris fontis TaxID=2496868 RepID=UPI00101C9B88|nr:type III-B CRISPR module RAMP protein Cmr6 [Candidatus Oscillochloris fontis]
MSSRRDHLQSLNKNACQHPGLWLDKFIPTQPQPQQRTGEDVETKRNLVTDTATIASTPAVLDLYRCSFRRWRDTLTHLADTELRLATARGRVVVGIGNASVLETAISLQRTYGIPYIPGSALKGLAAAYARQRLDDTWGKPATIYDPDDPAQQPPSAYELLFGATSTAGYVTFHDALWYPDDPAHPQSLAADVLTVHHQAYYNQGGSQAPTDWDSPMPIPFLTATGSFLLALSGPPAWRSRAFEILAAALDQMGVGAKTSSGYGRMDLRSLPPTSTTPCGKKGEQTAATPSPRTIPVVGQIITSNVIERNTQKIAIQVPGHAPEHVLAILDIQADTPAWQPGEKARVEVIAIETGEQRTILRVQRAPKNRKS